MKMVTIQAVEKLPADASHQMKSDYEAIKKAGPVVVPYVAATEALKNSKGLYMIKPEDVPKAKMVAPALNEMDDVALKRTYLMAMSSLGRKPTSKPITRKDMIGVIQQAEDAIEIVDEE